MSLFTYRASDPNEIRKLQEVLTKRDRVKDCEDKLDHMIRLCDQALADIMENQGHPQYPLCVHEESMLCTHVLNDLYMHVHSKGKLGIIACLVAGKMDWLDN